MQHKIIIARHRPGMRAALIGGGAFLLAVGAFALYAWTRATTVTDFERAQTELERLHDERRELARNLRAAKSEIEDLKGQLVYQQRSTEIDQQSCNEVRGSISGLQAEASDLREQLAFYRGIVSPEMSKTGIRIYEFRLGRTSAANVFRFELTLAQAIHRNRKVGGRAKVQLQGWRDTTRQTLAIDDMLVGGEKDLTFSFKYFEEIAGEFSVPAGFRPEQVLVELVAEGTDTQPVREQFGWDKSFKM